MKHKPDKLPTGRGFSWGRKTVSGTVVWRLFRRDLRNAIHQSQVVLGESACASYAAQCLRLARRKLRDQVDEIDIKLLDAA